VALRWLVEVLGLPPQTEGAFVTGATMANFTALAAARHVVLSRAGWNVEADGLFGAPPITVIVGEEAHPTLLKSLGLLGLGRNRVVRVPTDRRGRMRAERLPSDGDGPTIVCVQAGNINTGEFDPFGEICRASRGRPVPGCTSTVRSAFGPEGFTAIRAARAGRRARGLLGDRCPQVAERALRQRPCVRARTRMRCRRRWRSRPTTCLCTMPSAARPISPPSSRAARAASRCGPRCARSAARVSPRCSSATAARRASFAARARLGAGYEMLNDVVLNQVLVSFGSPDTTQRVIDTIQRRWHVLVRRHGLARPHGNADQCLLVGHDRMRTSSAARRPFCGPRVRRPIEPDRLEFSRIVPAATPKRRAPHPAGWRG
jgi:hypothetical protein